MFATSGAYPASIPILSAIAAHATSSRNSLSSKSDAPDIVFT